MIPSVLTVLPCASTTLPVQAESRCSSWITLPAAKNYPEKIASIVNGVAEGCLQSGAALIGGETAEMPGFYPVDEYDLAGFAVGVVDQKDLITGTGYQRQAMC